ncbi:hypothetical protein F5B20DRAFT_588488 [Whalleya microplaca]|nr:hypothetical protein F5B20DRAFT_588488 [Whalleya microplaca]
MDFLKGPTTFKERLLMSFKGNDMRSPSPQGPAQAQAHARNLKHRLLMDLEDDEDQENRRPPPPRRQTQYSAAPFFEKYRKPRPGLDYQGMPNAHTRAQLPRSPSPDLSSPLATEINENYAYLRATLHSAVITRLEEAEAELTAQTTAPIKSNRLEAARLEEQFNHIIAPLKNLAFDIDMVGESGQSSVQSVVIGDILAGFASKLEAVEEAQAEIEALGKAVLAGDQAAATAGEIIEISEPHVHATAEFGTELEQASKEVVEEMVEYEKKILQKIEQEAGNIVQSFLNR